jgi:glycosyltransferase involved in cell wall biosynthesis
MEGQDIFNASPPVKGDKIPAAMKILCISRKHPPSIGGMQRMNYKLIQSLKPHADVTTIKWGRSQAFLPLFVIWAILRSSAFIPRRRRPDVIYLGDALLAPVGLLLKKLLRRPVAATIHGRDIVFRFPLYRAIVSASLNRLDGVIGVSRYTTSLCLESGVRESLCSTIPNGIDQKKHTPRPSDQQAASQWLAQKGFKPDAHGPIIITVGRLVRRKGISWFTREVLPLLVNSHRQLLYIIAGDGKEKEAIVSEIRRRHLNRNTFITGRLSGEIIRGLLCISKVFVMPNIRVRGDVEGFGLVALEACCAGLPVVASDIEGIGDAIVDGENGFLIPAERPRKFAEAIETLLGNETKRKEAGERARAFTIAHYNWARCAQLYLKEFKRISQTAEGDSAEARAPRPQREPSHM